MGKFNKLLAAALDMSHEARMARAKEMGFDTDRVWYHGTDADLDAIHPSESGLFGHGVYTTKKPEQAGKYGDTLYPLYVRSSKPIGGGSISAEDAKTISEYLDGFLVDDYKSPYENWARVKDEYGADVASKAFASAGYDALEHKAYNIPFGAEQVRSVNAAFDPAKKDSGNLLASLAGAGVLAGAMLPSEDAEAGVISQALKAKYPDVQFWLTEKGDRATLDKVVVPEELRNSGLGTQFMQDLTEMASKEGKTLALTPSADFGGNKKRLEEFYRRFGFVPNKGRTKDYEISEGMYRLPAVGGAGLLGAAALSPEDATAAELVQATGPGPDLALLRAAYGEAPQEATVSGSVGNTLLELAAAANRGVTSGVDFFTVDQANALLQLLGSERQLPTLTETLAPATTGNFQKPGAHRDVTRFLGELTSPI